MSGTSTLTSEKRSGPSMSTKTIAPVQRLPISSIAWWYAEQQLSRCERSCSPSSTMACPPEAMRNIVAR
jgi:hypothetical protein